MPYSSLSQTIALRDEQQERNLEEEPEAECVQVKARCDICLYKVKAHHSPSVHVSAETKFLFLMLLL